MCLLAAAAPAATLDVQFLKALTREGFGRILFYDWRYLPGEKPNPEFVLNFPRYKGASVLLARANFGCGSSREHAPCGVETLGAPGSEGVLWWSSSALGPCPEGRRGGPGGRR